jgi:hypothetical protein
MLWECQLSMNWSTVGVIPPDVHDYSRVNLLSESRAMKFKVP